MQQIKDSQDRERSIEAMLMVGLQVLANKFGINVNQLMSTLAPRLRRSTAKAIEEGK